MLYFFVSDLGNCLSPISNKAFLFSFLVVVGFKVDLMPGMLPGKRLDIMMSLNSFFAFFGRGGMRYPAEPGTDS